MGNFEQFRAICNVNYFFPLPAVEYHPAKMGILWILDYGSRIPFGNGGGSKFTCQPKNHGYDWDFHG